LLSKSKKRTFRTGVLDGNVAKDMSFLMLEKKGYKSLRKAFYIRGGSSFKNRGNDIFFFNNKLALFSIWELLRKKTNQFKQKKHFLVCRRNGGTTNGIQRVKWSLVYSRRAAQAHFGASFRITRHAKQPAK
jgi:hypothetical protein